MVSFQDPNESSNPRNAVFWSVERLFADRTFQSNARLGRCRLGDRIASGVSGGRSFASGEINPGSPERCPGAIYDRRGLSGDTSRGSQSSLFHRLPSGVLCSAPALGEGYGVPATSPCLMRRATTKGVDSCATGGRCGLENVDAFEASMPPPNLPRGEWPSMTVCVGAPDCLVLSVERKVRNRGLL